MPCQHVKDVMGVLTTMSSETIRIRGSGDVPPPSLSTLLCQAHEILLSECTEIGRKERTTNNNIQQSFTTTTGCHDNVRTTTTTSTTLRAIDTSTRLFRYFQLLLSIVDVSSSNKTSTTNSTTTTTTSSTNNNNNNINVGEEIIITGRQVEIWIANLLKPFIEAICRWIEERVGVGGTKDNNNNNNNNNDDGMLDTTMTTKSEGGGITPTSQAAGRDDDDDEDDDDDDPLMNDLHHQKQQSCSDHDDDVRPVVVFVWRMMIRFNQTYAAQVLGLLAPVWKNMTDLVSSIVRCQHQRIEANAAAAANATTKNEVDIWRSDCFESLFEDTLENIHELTHDGKVRLERLAIEHLAVTASTKQDSSIVSTAETKQYLRHVKIMGFAAHKLCQLVKDYLAFVDNKRSSLSTSASTSTSKPNKPRLFMDVWRTLFGLRGMAAVFQELYLMDKSDKNDKDRLICKIFCQVAAKAGDAIDNINVSQQDLLINIPAIEMILQESASSDNDAEEDDDNTTIQAGAKVSKDRKIMSRFILRSSRDIGRLMTLQRVLTVSETNSHENIEPLIAIVENMFSASVPRCLSICLLATEAKHRNVPSATTPFDGALTSALVLNSLTLMTRVITAINRTLASSSSSDDNNSSTSLCNNRQASYHRLLLGWLSLNNAQAQQPRQQNREKAHPLAREMIVLLLHKVILNLSFTSGQQGSAVRLLSYLVKIMFDERSSSVLRRNVSSILILLQKQSESSSDSASSSFGPFDISDITRFMLEKELECQWKKEDTSKGKKSTKKRKREANGAPISFYGSDNLLLLSQVFSQSAMSTSNDSIDLVAKLPSITKCIEQLYQNASKVTSSDSHNYVVLQSSIERNVISMAFLERLCRCDDVTENYQLPSGKIFDMICSIIRAVVKVEVHEEDNQSKVGNTVQLYRSALGLATTACIRFSNAEDIGRLFTCTRKLFSTVVSFVTSIRKDVSSVESKQIAALLSAESYALFGRLGRVVPNDCSSRHLEVRRLKSDSSKFPLNFLEGMDETMNNILTCKSLCSRYFLLLFRNYINALVNCRQWKIGPS